MKALSANVLFLQFVCIFALILIDVIVTVAGAIFTGRYDWNKLLLFLKTNVVPYLLIWGVLAGAGWVTRYFAITDATLTGLVVFVDIVYGLIVLRLAVSILTTFKDLGINAPTKAPPTP